MNIRYPAFIKGQYKCQVPIVVTNLWTVENWIDWINWTGQWFDLPKLRREYNQEAMNLDLV